MEKSIENWYQVCKRCNKKKNITEYHWRKDTKSNGGYRYVCKECACKRAKESYERNKEKVKKRCAEAAKTRILERRKYIYEYLSKHPCIKCGEDDPRCLDFDHIEPDNKDLAISRAIWNNWSMKRLNNEIEKCQILCANCHRKRTAEQMKWYSFDGEKENIIINKELISFKGDKVPVITKEDLLKEHLEKGKEYIEKKYVPFVKASLREYVEKNGWFYPPKPSCNDREKVINKIIKNSNFSFEINEFSSMTSEGTSYLKGLFRSYWNVLGGPVESFNDEKSLDRVLKYRLGINNSKDYKYILNGKEVFYNEIFDITLANIRRGFIVQRNAVSFFKPRVACEIYYKFLENIEKPKVWDPSCGFGARMLGFYSFLRATNKKGVYYGNEPADQIYKDNLLLGTNLCDGANNMGFYISKCGSELKIRSGYNNCDLVFTSPPYFDREKYFDKETQCWKQYPNLKIWKQKYLSPTFNNAYLCLKKGGHLVINISQDLTDIVSECALNAGFILKEKMKLIIGKDHFSKKEGNRANSYEPILVFVKND